MALVAALIPDLMFGSRVAQILSADGHEVVLCAREDDARAQAASAGLLLCDLAADGVDGIRLLETVRAAGALRPGARTLAVYSHVDADTRAAAVSAGFDLVVPRSRFVREGDRLVADLLAAPSAAPPDRPDL